MKILIDSLFAACSAIYFVNVVRLQDLSLYEPTTLARKAARALGLLLNRKPFTCSICLAAWIGLTVGILKGYGAEAVYPMAIGGISAIFINKTLNLNR